MLLEPEFPPSRDENMEVTQLLYDLDRKANAYGSLYRWWRLEDHTGSLLCESKDGSELFEACICKTSI